MVEKVFSATKEFKRLLMHQKKWAKHWLTPTAHRAHSSTCGLHGPAQLTLDFICSMENDANSDEFKIRKLLEFYETSEKVARSNRMMGFGFYHDAASFVRANIIEIEAGGIPLLPHMPKA